MTKYKNSNPFFIFCANVLPVLTIFFVGLYLFFFHVNLIPILLKALALTWLSALLFKILFHKLRPHHKKIHALCTEESCFSFPSEHASIFAALGIFCCSINPVLGILLICTAFLIGASRAITGIHFWNDIIAGWMLGIIIALIFI